jgi:hypothetical protein
MLIQSGFEEQPPIDAPLGPHFWAENDITAMSSQVFVSLSEQWQAKFAPISVEAKLEDVPEILSIYNSFVQVVTSGKAYSSCQWTLSTVPLWFILIPFNTDSSFPSLFG